MAKNENEKNAQKKYIEAGHYINIFFSQKEEGLYKTIERHAEQLGVGKATFIKMVLKGDGSKNDNT